MAGFGGTIKLTGEEEYRNALRSIATNLQQVAAQQKLTAATYEKSDTSLSALSQRSKDLTSKLDAQKQKLDAITNALKKWRSEQESNKNTINNLQAQLDKEKKKLEEIARQYGTNSKEYQNQAKVVNELEKELAELNTQYDKNEQSIKKNEAAQTSAQAAVMKTEKEIGKLAVQAEKSANSTEELGNETEIAGKKAQSATSGFTVLKGVIANLASDVIRRAADGLKTMAKNMVSAGIDFDAAMSKVEAVSGATGNELAKLSAKAEEMGKKTKFSATESAEAFNYMAMAGWKTEDMLSGIDGIMALAAASGSDLATTTDIVTDALTAMGYSASDAGRLADVMAAASSNANTNVEMMGETFKYAASIAGSLGYSMEDVAIATGLMANSGIKGEQAGTALRAIMQRLATDTGGAATAMREMGVETTNADGTMRPLSDVMDDLRVAMSGLNDEEKTNIAKTIAGTNAMGGLLAIVNSAPADYDKLTSAVKNSTGAAEKMAATMQNNVAGKFTLLKSQLESVYLTIYRKIEPSLSKAIDIISKALSKVDWEGFGEKAGAALEKLARGFEWLLANQDIVVGALTAITSAFAVKKVTDFGSGLVQTATTLASLVKPAASAASAVSAATGAMTAVGTSATGATTATTALKVAVTALGGPLAAVTAAAAGLLALVIATGGAFKESTSEIEQNAKSTGELAKKQKESAETLAENQKAREAYSQSINQELEYTDALVYRLDRLANKTEKTAIEKKEMQEIVEELNRLIPDLALSYNAETDSLSENTSKIEANIEARKNLNQAEAERTNLAGITEDMTEAEKELAEAVSQNEKNERTYLDAKKAREDFENRYTKLQIENNVALQKELTRLMNDENSALRIYENGKKVVSDYTNGISSLKDEYEKTATAAEDFARRADVAVALEELGNKAREAGRDVPIMLAEGMEEGRYAVPNSIAELDKLVEFDSAIQRAGLAGEQIPISISAGLISGQYSVAEAMQMVQQNIELADKVTKMFDDGLAISSNLADGIRSGKISVDEANAEIKASTDFTELSQNAQAQGILIPTYLAQGVRDNTYTATEAVAQMKALMEFTDLSQKAAQTGIEIPSFMATQISAGELLPSDAVNRMQALINYQQALSDAGLAGVTIPQNIVNGILSGEMTVTNTVATMNSWVQFKNAIETTNAAGHAIPRELAQDILSGRATATSAVDSMNRWVQFQEALRTTQAAGRDIPSWLARAIMSGQMEPINAVRMLNQQMGNEALRSREGGQRGGNAFVEGVNSGLNSGTRWSINGSVADLGHGMTSTLMGAINAHSPSRDSMQAGNYFLDGLYAGVANQSKRSSIFSAIFNFGTSLVSKLKAALDEHSPSKATKDIGINFLLGFSEGFDDEQRNVLKNVSRFGKNVLGTFDSAVGQGMTQDIFGDLRRISPSSLESRAIATTNRLSEDLIENPVTDFKKALSDMKIVLDEEEVGRFVDRSVTDLVFN